ncbi:tRNA 2-selenouridine(34) synthase MnmH [uncultured Sunxiuqinia sp.]|uniref:tRNA 2-selenouridine(34) synthase MnmH n=1 Tax=uncultured Sunxiuqinia sp. TaxID=1573825 RepID=UPI002AA71D7C|nr:tRNA 2-selenouridine(34) synthase MnmH [uncultured Sunxiuqinia sp.]
MITKINIGDYFAQEHPQPLIDVRSPGEYDKGHIPGATNIALFSNEERADVGTVYVRQSREKAIELGYKYVTPKLDWFISESRKVAGKSAVAVHCWRGGMRSQSFAEHLHKNGFDEVYLITGGYKAYRNYVLSFFDQPFQLRVLGGYTGSGKTQLLHKIKKMGQQVIDLEGLAHHKGSAFGAIGEVAQPTVEQFENHLHLEFSRLNLNKPIWMEDESHNIGRVKIPIVLFRQIREQSVYFIDIPKAERAKFLVGDYASFGNELLASAINGISKRLGGQNVKLAHDYLAENNYFKVAMIALQYYDKAYKKGVEHRETTKVHRIKLSKIDMQINAQILIKFTEEYERNQAHEI